MQVIEEVKCAGGSGVQDNLARRQSKEVDAESQAAARMTTK